MEKSAFTLSQVVAMGLVLLGMAAHAAQPAEVLVSAPGVDVEDPEWSPLTSEMVYCARDNQVHVLPVNPSTGRLVNPGGLSDNPLGPCTRETNGPEIGFTQSEMVISWTVDTGNATALGLATRPLGGAQWQSTYPLPDTAGYRSSYPIQSPSAPAPWLLHAQGPINSTIAEARAALDPSQVVLVSPDTKVPRWITGTNKISYVDSDGSIKGLDVFSGVRRQFLAATTDTRKSPTVWLAPETGRRTVSLFNKGANCLEIYSDAASEEPAKSICGADFGENHVLSSPEPFVLSQRSYIVFRVVEQGGGNQYIYVAGAIDLEGESSFLQRTSSLKNRKRREPEAFVSGNRAFLYFSGPNGYGGSAGQGVWRMVFNGRP